MSLNVVTQGFGAGEKFETRLLIPSKMGGAVIGKKGCNIQQLRSDYNAMIRSLLGDIMIIFLILMTF